MAEQAAVRLRRRVKRKLALWRRFMLGIPVGHDTGWFWKAMREKQPKFTVAVLADARVTASRRGERYEFRNNLDATIQIIRLAFVTDAFFGQLCYRAKASTWAHRIPVLPRVLHHMAVSHAGICIGDPVVMQPGVHIPHGFVTVNGGVEVGRGVVLSPYSTLGRVSTAFGGPVIGPMVSIGTGAKVLGPVRVGERAKIGANSVVLSDVPAGATAVGAPARVVDAPAEGVEPASG